MSKAPTLTPACVWRVSTPLLLALQERLGDPLDSYVNGSQVWLREDGPNEMTIEYRLHPAAGYMRPTSLTTLTVFSATVFALANADEPALPLDRLWGGLEAFPAFDDEIEPAPLQALVTGVIGLAPDAAGLVDHRSIGDQWEREQGAVSIVDLLLAELTPEG